MKKLFVAYIYVFWSCVSYATTLPSLYDIDIAVSSQSSEEKGHAIKDGFLDVLKKVSGNPQIASVPAIKASLDKSDYYVQEYRYSAANTSSSQYLLKIKFDKTDVDRLLKKAGAANWGQSRPLTLVWLGMHTKNSVEIIGTEMSANIAQQFINQSSGLGLPMIFPLMDVEDMNQLSYADVKNMNIETLKKVGERYTPEAMLIGNIEQTDNDLQGNWLLMVGEEQSKWTSTANSLQEMSRDLSKKLATYLIKNPAKSEPLAQQFKVQVTHIAKPENVSELLSYLNHLTILEKVELQEVAGDTIYLTFNLKSSMDQLQRQLEEDQKLRFIAESDHQLELEWGAY